jgi:NTE family protein
MKIDGVFSGGGVKAFAFIGALEEVERKGLHYERVAGTSAGAIISSLVAAGYQSAEIKKLLLELDMNMFLEEPKFGNSIPFLNWLLMYFRLGVYKGDQIEQWIHEKLLQKGIQSFGDLPKEKLKIIGSDISLGRMVVFPDDLERFYQIDPYTFSIAKAVRISATIPFFFIPIKLTNVAKHQSILVDGGILSNFPIWLFTDDDLKKKRPILGMKLSSSNQEMPERKIDGAFDMYKALFSTMMKAHDARHISQANSSDIMFIPTGNIDSTDFDLSQNKKRELIEMGRTSAIKFFKKWTY